MSQSIGSQANGPDDLAAALEAIRAAVRQRAGFASRQAVPQTLASSPVADAAELATISAHLPVTWETPVVGRAVALAKRVTRLGLRWYINPIVEQQNAFNEAVVRALSAIEVRQGEIERQLELLQRYAGQSSAE